MRIVRHNIWSILLNMCLIRVCSLSLTLAISIFPVSTCSAADIRPGWSARIYKDADGGEHRYVLFVPHSYQSAQKLPVLLYLNGRGENGDDGFNQIKKQIGIQAWEMKEFFPFLVVGPQCRKNSSWSGNTDHSRWAVEILDEVITEFDADRDRVYLTGVSSGGSGAWNIGSEHIDRFAAIVPLCGNGGDLEKIAQHRLPVWNFINNGDSSGLVNGSRQARFQLIQQGESPLFTEFHSKGHDCWNAAYRFPPLYGWLLQQRKSQNGKEPLFEYLSPDVLLSSWSRQGEARWSAEENDTLVAMSHDGHAAEQESVLVSSKSARSQELHADVWMEQGSGFTLALIPEEGQAGEVRIVGLLPEAGAGGIFQSGTQTCLSSLDLAAEQSLKPNWWNDVRVRMDNGRLTVRLNGWSAADVSLNNNSGSRWRFALVLPPESLETRWRYVRTRELK
jgi:Predicted peptidase